MRTGHELRVLSVYEGFFSGGARIVHSDIVLGLTEGGQHHQVLSLYGEVHREATRQRMEDDTCYRALTAAGVGVTSLGRTYRSTGVSAGFTGPELAGTARATAGADVVLSLKEQPLALLNQAGLPRRPVVVCLHRSDPENQGTALDELKAAIADGTVVACVCCAESTRSAYRAAGIPSHLLHVIPNGVDLFRFRPDAARRLAVRTELGIDPAAPVVVFAARYDGMKNVPLLLAAARAWLSRVPDGQVLMCGAGMTAENPGLTTDLATAFEGATALADRGAPVGRPTRHGDAVRRVRRRRPHVRLGRGGPAVPDRGHDVRRGPGGDGRRRQRGDRGRPRPGHGPGPGGDRGGLVTGGGRARRPRPGPRGEPRTLQPYEDDRVVRGPAGPRRRGHPRPALPDLF